MTEEFKVGDVVVCASKGTCEYVTIGKEYTVNHNLSGVIGIVADDGLIGYYEKERFKKVEKEKEMDYDFVKTETKRTIKDGSTLIDTMVITNGSVKGVVRLSICNSKFAALDSEDIDELIKRLQVVKEVLDSNK